MSILKPGHNFSQWNKSIVPIYFFKDYRLVQSSFLTLYLPRENYRELTENPLFYLSSFLLGKKNIKLNNVGWERDAEVTHLNHALEHELHY